MTKQVKHMALLIAVVLLGGSAVFLMAKQTSKAPADNTNYFCPYQTMGWHMGMQPMMMTDRYQHMGMAPMMMSGRYMASNMKAGEEMNGRGGYYCYFGQESPSTGKPARNGQTANSTPKKAPSRQP